MAARKGTAAAQQEKARKVKIPSVWDMEFETLRAHCRARHPRIPFITKNEHQQMHRLHPPTDHVHNDPSGKEEPGESPDSAEAGNNDRDDE